METPFTDSEAIEADLRVDEADYVEAFAAQAKANTRALQKGLAVTLAISALVVAIGWPVPLGVWVLLLPAAIAGIVLAPRQPRFLARRAFALRHPAWHDVRLTLDAERLTVRADKLESYRPWKQIDDWLETPRLFVLVAAGGVSDLWPKAAFAPGDVARVRELLDRKVHLERPAAAATASTSKAARTGRIVLWVILVLGLFAVYALWRTTT